MVLLYNLTPFFSIDSFFVHLVCQISFDIFFERPQPGSREVESRTEEQNRRVGEKNHRPGKKVYGTEKSGKAGISFIQLERIRA
jgi:hypothetical protein